MKHLLYHLILLLITFSFSCSQPRYSDPLSPEEALQSFTLSEGFKIELFAAEPQVLDPVSMIFDEKGDAYVVEMPDYPYKPEVGQGKGRIRKIVDTDGDGRVDQATIFADSLSEATSILPWKGGLIVTTAPYILYLKDTNNDHSADQREVLFSGFFENNSEAQITNLRFGIDNWIYAANFGQPGEVRFDRMPNAGKLSMKGGDFRFRLDRGHFELATGPTQFGQTMDDSGHRFMTQNTIHLRHAVIPYRYLHRHAFLPSTAAVHNISDHDLDMFQQTPAPYWRAERTRRRQKQYDEQDLDREEYADDHFTGCSGGTFYAGDAFPSAFYGNIFTGDVAGNLIHRDILSPLEDSPTFVAKRAKAEQDREFLSSTDSWFRPASFTLGPDGYLYVIDYYRQHIETPLSIPEDLKADMDFYNGSQRGRIYRIMPENATAQGGAFPDLSNKSSQDYVGLLAHSNRWQRLLAQKLLLERQDVSIEPEVRALFQQHQDPRVRLHALYVLEGLHLLDVELVKQAMGDTNTGIREHGIILSERFPACLPQLLDLVNDRSARVAFQASLSLGEFFGDEVIAALAQSVVQYGADPWFRKAVLSSHPGSSLALMESLVQQNYFSGVAQDFKASFLEDFSFVIAHRNYPGEVNNFIKLLSNTSLLKEKGWQFASLKGLSKGLKKSTTKLETDAHLQAWLAGIESEAGEEMKELIEVFRTALEQPL